MAEEVITQPNYERLCSNILNSDKHIRFAEFNILEQSRS
jgi:hypothetical protein